VRADEADVDAVEVVDDEHDDEQRQDVALDLATALVSTASRPADGSRVWFTGISH
jgi:hypothetical protein